MPGSSSAHLEVLEKKRVLIEEITKSTTTVGDPQPAVPVVPGLTAHEIPVLTAGAGDWLVSIEKDVTAAQGGQQPRIGKVLEVLRKNKKHYHESFEPAVVAIGPYHHGKDHLEAMEYHKKNAAVKFADGRMEEFYEEVAGIVHTARKCYAHDPIALSDEEFARMMFLDGCFLLHFVHTCQGGKKEEQSMRAHLHGFVIRDMFLLENQLPYVVLQALMKLKPVNLNKFIEQLIPTQEEEANQKAGSSSSSSSSTHLHLLGHLRATLLGDSEKKDPTLLLRGDGWHQFRSVMELKAVGVRLSRSSTKNLREIKFNGLVVCATLSIPRIIIDDTTKSRFLNMIAMEMSPDGGASDYGITSFVWFLDCLIDHDGDVRELREKRILMNMLGSDEQVADLFNELATDLVPDMQAYDDVLRQIDDYCKNRVRVSIFEMLYTHFHSPWTTISFIAGVLLIGLTVVSTFYTIFPRK